jgi:fibronectin-binding autotransporter adhesin
MPRRAALRAWLGAWAICAASAHAATFDVTATTDTGDGSLREAVADANDSADASNTISFDFAAPSTIQLSSDLEAVESPTLIFDNATNAVIVDGNDAIVFQNADTAHDFTFDDLVTFRDGELHFTEAGTGTISGTLKGTDVDLFKAGAGTITLGAGQTITLDSTSSISVDAGTLAVNGSLTNPGTLDVAAPATLQIGSGGVVTAGTVTSDGTIDVGTGGALNATSSLLVGPSGTLLVDGTVNAGTRTITNHGTVVANGSLTAGSLVIASDGVLMGDTAGTSVTAPVTVSGRVEPSTATGRLGVSGPVTFGPTSTFEVDIGAGNTGDTLAVANTVTISPGARLALVADPTTFGGAASSVTVLTATSLSGQFSETDYAFFVEGFDYGANSLTVTLTPTAQTFTPFAQTPNQLAVAGILDAVAADPSDDLQEVLDAVFAAEEDEIAPLLDAIGGESLTAFATARQILAERTSLALHRRVRDPVWGTGRAVYAADSSGTPDVAAAGDDELEPEAARPALVRPSAWLDVLGVFGELDGETGEAEVDTLLYGGTFGADATIADQFVVGLAAGYARSDVDLDQREADVFGDTVQGALYAGFVDPRGYLSAYGRYAYTFETSRRTIEAGTLARRARASFDAQDYGAGGELGVTLFSFAGVAFQPIAGVDWLRMDEESFTEHGAGDLNLDVDPETLESTTTRLGGRVFARLDMDEMGVLVPELRAFYQHLSGDRERVLDARLSGAPGLGSIGVRGAELPRENLLLGVGWGVLVGTNLTMSLDYDAVLGSDRVEHQGTIAARILF